MRKSIIEVSEEYITDTHFENIIKNKFVTRILADVASEAIDEIIIEDYVQNKCDELIAEFVPPMAVHMLESLQVIFLYFYKL